MRLLLDTCIVYDWLMGAIENRPVIERIQAEGAFVSSVSVWELAIKSSLGKLSLPSGHIAEDIESQGFQWLSISPYHAQGVLGLDNHHKDPFDRLLIAQANHEGLLLVTYDAVFKNYLGADAVLVIQAR